MDINVDKIEPSTPPLSDNVICKRIEDSGYHTFTPSSVVCLEKSYKNLHHVDYNVTPDVNIQLDRKHRCKISKFGTQNDAFADSPRCRRGIKRIYQDISDENDCKAARTPTTIIAGGLQDLKVSDFKCNKVRHTSYATSSATSEFADSAFIDLYKSDYSHASLSFPSTPVKKICRSSCNLNLMKKSPKKLNFTIHSLSCASNELQSVTKNRQHSKVVRSMQFIPGQKIDIIKKLHKQGGRPPLVKIFSYLSDEDISSFSLVSSYWCNVWNEISNKQQKHKHKIYLENIKKNLENQYNILTPKNCDGYQMKGLKEEHNILNAQLIEEIPRSPPGTPRTNKFKKFAKCASLCAHLQKCVRCEQPAIVNKETSDEEWVQCMSSTCAYQFCKSCNCVRHPGKTCLRYDLNGPSPSKRKKNSCVIGSLKSKRSLRRLL